MRSAAPDDALRRETWENSAAGVSVCVGSDYGVVLGLDFSAGERGQPDGAWIRSQRDTGAVHWRLGAAARPAGCGSC